MDAEIIAVGSELLTPHRTDTNSLFLTQHLNNLGVEVTAKTIVGDDRNRLSSTVREALARVGIVVLTGGLGPTEDDVTRDAVASALGRTLEFHQDICDHIEERFRRYKRVMVEINRRQAYVIEGAEVLPNPQGTAPGQWIEQDGHTVMLLPGPPNEMRPMFLDQCVPRFERLLPPQAIRTLVFRIAGMPESTVDQLVSPVYTRYANPVTTILAAAGDIQLHLRARCRTVSEAEHLLAEVGAQIEPLLGDRIYSRNGDPLETVVGNLLRQRKETLSVAESCTGGMLAEKITSIAGSSDYFVGGFLVYTEQTKTALLGVRPETLREHTAVSKETAEEMALNARARTGATWAISVTGIAGPGGGSEATPVGTMYTGVAGPDGCHVHHSRFLSDRTRNRTFVTQIALDLLRRRLCA